MGLEALDLVPNCVELLEVVFKDFILCSFYSQLITRDSDFINLEVLFLPCQYLVDKILHDISKNMDNNLMESLKRL